MRQPSAADWVVLEQIRLADNHELQALEARAEIDYEEAHQALVDARSKHVGRDRAVAAATSNFREARNALVEARMVRRINENRTGHGIVIANGVG